MENLENEVWKPVVGYESQYQVSNLGRVKSKGFNYDSKNNHRCVVYPKFLSLVKSARYLSVTLTDNKKHKTIKVHRLVCQAFLPNPENKPQINHINGIRYDNRVENLEWCTAKENIKHAIENGLRANLKGEQLTQSKLKEYEVREIKKLLSMGHRPIDIFNSKKFSCKYYTFVQINSGKIWKHIIV